MCYNSPGPQCSEHAQENLVAAEQAWDQDPNNYALYENVLKREEEFYTTPMGWVALEQRRARSLSPFKRFALKKKLRRGMLTRNNQFKAYAALELEKAKSAHGSYEEIPTERIQKISTYFPSIKELLTQKKIVGTSRSASLAHLIR